VTARSAVPTQHPGRNLGRPKPGAARDADVENPRVLTARLHELQLQRRDHEREANQLPQLLRGIAVTRRDRDAGVSQPLRAHRAHLERVWAGAEDLIVAAVRVAVRLELRGGDDTDPVVRRARRALKQSQDALRALSDGLEAKP
jgi:hypothetical protein